jgi:plastocyanin
MFSSLSLGLALLPFVLSKTFDVQVGGPNGTLEFSPPALSAAVGDTVVFHFNPKNHSVYQSSFDAPCSRKEGGFASPFMFVAANSSVDTRPTWSVTVNDTDPVWVYCAQAANTPASHCGQGMIFSINCPSDDSPNSLGNFKKEALAIGASLSAAAAAASATPSGGQDGGSPTVTAAYGGVTIPPAPSASVVTAAITLDGSSIWTTVYTSFVNSPAATPVAADGAVHTVVVGGTGKLFFTPDHIVAAPRDQIVFQFQQKNHSVVQSSFADPCRPLNALNATAPQGFNSGYHPVGANDTDFPTWSITVNDTAPIWAYCGQTTPSSHCGAGMVFAVNAVDNSTRNFAAFQGVAEQLNGTGSASASGSQPSQTDSTTGGALSLRVGGGASAVVALIAVAASLL